MAVCSGQQALIATAVIGLAIAQSKSRTAKLWAAEMITEKPRTSDATFSWLSGRREVALHYHLPVGCG